MGRLVCACARVYMRADVAICMFKCTELLLQVRAVCMLKCTELLLQVRVYCLTVSVCMHDCIYTCMNIYVSICIYIHVYVCRRERQ